MSATLARCLCLGTQAFSLCAQREFHSAEGVMGGQRLRHPRELRSGLQTRWAHRLQACVPLLAGLVLNGQAAINDDAQSHQVVDSVVPHFCDQLQIPGMAVGLSLRGKTYFFPCSTADESGRPFTPDTVVEIGSRTKVFTTTQINCIGNELAHWL